MGLFGKKFDFDRLQTGLRAAQATLDGDYGAAAQMWGQHRQAKRERRKEEQFLQLLTHLRPQPASAGEPTNGPDAPMSASSPPLNLSTPRPPFPNALGAGVLGDKYRFNGGDPDLDSWSPIAIDPRRAGLRAFYP